MAAVFELFRKKLSGGWKAPTPRVIIGLMHDTNAHPLGPLDAPSQKFITFTPSPDS